jgi:hypothetical protein
MLSPFSEFLNCTTMLGIGTSGSGATGGAMLLAYADFWRLGGGSCVAMVQVLVVWWWWW